MTLSGVPTSRSVPFTRRIVLTMVLVIASSATGCASLKMLLRGGFQTPAAKLENVALESVALDAVTIAARFRVENPNPVDVKLVGVDWSFSFDGEPLLDGRLDQPLVLAADGSTSVTIPVRIPYKAIPNAVLTFARRPQAPYEVTGHLEVDTPLGRRAVPVRWSGDLPRPSLGH